MAFAQCKNQDCNRVLSRSGKRGFRLEDYCCPHCGGDIKNAQRPYYWTDGQAVSKWFYEELVKEPDLREEMTRKEITGWSNFQPKYHQMLINELMAFCL